jgi:fatty acid desaturase
MSDEFDHKALLASLSSEQRQSLLEKSDKAGLLHLMLYLSMVVVGAALILNAVWFYPLVIVGQGALMVFFFTLLHEASHKTPFKSDRLNTLAAHMAGFIIFLPPTWFRYFHLAHHRHTHDPDNDPELSQPKPQTIAGHLVYMTGLPETVNRIKSLFFKSIQQSTEEFVPERGRAKVLREYRLYLLAYAALLTGSFLLGTAALFWIWILPFLVGGPFMRGYLLAEHSLCPHTDNMLANTRTTFTNRVVRFIAWNMPFHAEHHVHANVPFHKLPEFHQITSEYLQSTEDGYVKFNELMWARLKLLNTLHDHKCRGVTHVGQC